MTASSIDVVKAGHIEYLVTDLGDAREFYVKTLGLIETDSDENHLYLRGLEDRYHHCLLLTLSESPGVGHISFKVRGEGDLKGAARLLKREGLEPVWIEGGEEVGQGRALRVQDPFGFPVEFYCEMESAEWMLRRFDSYRGGRVMRLDHFNLLLPAVEDAYAWYCGRLGFGCTELTETEGEKPAIWAAWLRRKHTCHDIALTTGKGPRVHHAGFAVADRTCIMDCADLLASKGFANRMERGPGRHGISNAFFLYLLDPDGNRLELYTGDYLSADPDWEPIRWKLNDTQRQTFWGAPTPASWFNDAMLVTSFRGRGFISLKEPKMQDRPDYLLNVR